MLVRVLPEQPFMAMAWQQLARCGRRRLLPVCCGEWRELQRDAEENRIVHHPQRAQEVGIAPELDHGRCRVRSRHAQWLLQVVVLEAP